MWPYWILFLVPAYLAVTKLRVTALPLPLQEERWSGLWRVMFVFLMLMIGLRHEVGGDWGNYLGNLEGFTSKTLIDALNTTRGDPTDSLLNWITKQLGLSIYFINTLYATLFTWGVLVFCRQQPRPWLALTVSVPYLIIVVGMGYTRQGVAIGLAMLGLVALENKRVLKFLIWIAIAATIHKSAVILIPLALLAGTRRWLLALFWVCFTVVLLFGLLVQESIDNLMAGYIYAEYASSGASIRIAMNALPAALFLLFRNRFRLANAQRIFWMWMACGALAFVALLFILPSSTAVDRMALYWIPLQLFVWSRLPDAMGRPSGTNEGWVYVVVAYSAIVQFVWLFFADNAGSWLPYQFYPWVWLWG
jgi:hypothetical protein